MADVHTPWYTPWTAEWSEEASDWNVVAAMSEPDAVGMTHQPNVCTLSDWFSEDVARLIAAAPELLGALRHIIRCEDDAKDGLQNGAGLLDCIDNHSQFYQSADLAQAITTARAAIAKASSKGPAHG